MAITVVSTLSRLKAAGGLGGASAGYGCFNTQPPEGGCEHQLVMNENISCFNTQPPEGGCHARHRPKCATICFNTQPPEGG